MEETGLHSKCEGFHFVSALRAVVQCVTGEKLLLQATPLLGGGRGRGGEGRRKSMGALFREFMKLITEGRKLEMKHIPVHLLFSNSDSLFRVREAYFLPSFLCSPGGRTQR